MRYEFDAQSLQALVADAKTAPRHYSIPPAIQTVNPVNLHSGLPCAGSAVWFVIHDGVYCIGNAYPVGEPAVFANDSGPLFVPIGRWAQQIDVDHWLFDRRLTEADKIIITPAEGEQFTRLDISSSDPARAEEFARLARQHAVTG